MVSRGLLLCSEECRKGLTMSKLDRLLEYISPQRTIEQIYNQANEAIGSFDFDKATVDAIITQIKQVVDLGVKLGIVIGGGNIFRGINGSELGLNRANADAMGMLATVMNGIALKDFLTNAGIESKLYSALAITNMVKG